MPCHEILSCQIGLKNFFNTSGIHEYHLFISRHSFSGFNTIVVSIIDNGCGISDEIKDRIFDPFFSTKAGKKNTGLGLSICQHIIESHEGVILCESRGNTTMSVRLPIYRDTSI